MSVIGDPFFRPTARGCERGANIRPRTDVPAWGTGGVGDAMRDAQADVPST
jgi:hypothetical protein